MTPSCEVCGAEKVVGHHDDYSRPLDVRWLCHAHHAQLHADLAKNGTPIQATHEQKKTAWSALAKLRAATFPESGRSRTIKLCIDQATHDQLKERAERAERTVAAEIRLALRKHLAAVPAKGAA